MTQSKSNLVNSGIKLVIGSLVEGIQWAQSQVYLRSFTWLSFIYFLKYKLAQNHSDLSKPSRIWFFHYCFGLL